MKRRGLCKHTIHTPLIRPIVRIIPIHRIALHIDDMRLEISTTTFTLTAILTAVKKQQSFADWRVVDSANEKVVLEFQRATLGEKETVRQLEAQIADEQIREKLEKDFGEIRNRLVDLALAPIIKA